MTPQEIAREAAEHIRLNNEMVRGGYDTPHTTESIILSAAAKMHAGGEPWRKCSESLPEIPVIVWVSEGGGSALLARWDRYRWENATTIKGLPFHPIWWKPLTLPESPGPLRYLTEHKP